MTPFVDRNIWPLLGEGVAIAALLGIGLGILWGIGNRLRDIGATVDALASHMVDIADSLRRIAAVMERMAGKHRHE